MILYNKCVTFTADSINDILFDGATIWACTDSVVYQLAYWGQSNNNEEFLDLDDQFTQSMSILKTIPITLSGKKILSLAQDGNYIFVFVGQMWIHLEEVGIMQRIYKININTGELSSEIIIPVELYAHCYPIIHANKIWFVTRANYDSSLANTEEDFQKLFTFNILTSTFSPTTIINATKQFTPKFLLHTYEDMIGVINKNSYNIKFFDVNTQEYIKTTFINNRRPTAGYTTSNKEIYITSRNGLGTKIDFETSSFSHLYNFAGEADDVNNIGGATTDDYHWVSSDSGLARVHKVNQSNNYVKSDVTLKLPVSITTAHNILVTPQITYTTNNMEEKIVYPYVFVVTGMGTFERSGTTLVGINTKHIGAPGLFKNIDPALVNNFTIRLNGMIATGMSEYHGETE